MAGKRGYDDPCGVARALDVIGERWALLVVRELLLGPKRFTDLKRGLPAASQNVLSQRLHDLDESGIVRRRKLGPPASTWVYELTERGRELEPVVVGLARWGSRLPMESDAELSADALVLALRTTFDADAADGLHATYDLRLGDDRFTATITDNHIAFTRGGADDCDVAVSSSVAVFRALVFGGRQLDDAVDRGELTIAGDRAVLERFVGLFLRPTVSS